MSSLDSGRSLQTILIVDDTPENLTALGELLQGRYRVRAARSAQRAIEISGSDPQPDLILLDVMMPVMDGYQCLKILRQNPRTDQNPVIFVTAMDSTEEETYGLDLGAVDYITKPIRPSIVLARVQTHLDLKQARDLLRRQNADLEAEVVRRLRENQIVEDVGIRALAHLAEIRDPETGNHILRTQEYVRVLAQTLSKNPAFTARLDDRTIETYAKSAPLHDIGKVGIPDNILLKPGSLTAEEWIIMRTHARLGAEAIAQAQRDVSEDVAFLAVGREIAHYHHEKWNGAGYPDGLKGEEIPLPARLMALADVFDALTTRRVYKPPMEFSQARDIILHDSGSHFDPDVVAAFVESLPQFMTIAQTYRDPLESHP